ncbi:response regulator transcription factor [Phreatobacter aquaticus]|uniref:Response regulator transcription factor n=1 Tax=Phreatobacter aquaticus TaxID=2570229 RepID=A0A4D7QG59_9HYPH|nr:response regulator transcription factor [Phreatobacter aquaticus]QCK84454.1 response regulator transcription factor [Phreatobacter aquaticus]
MSRRTAVIADDHGMYRMGLAFTLKDRLGFDDVEEAGSLDEALARLGENGDIALALFDLSMPGMASAASLAAVRECYPDLPIAVVSASENRNDVLEALAAGVNGFVPKRLVDADLVAALQAIVDGAIFVPSSMALGAAGRTAPPAAHVIDLTRLTPRQRDVLGLLVQGRSNKEIARALDLGHGTVKIHLAALFRHLGVHNRAAAVAAAAPLLAKL